MLEGKITPATTRRDFPGSCRRSSSGYSRATKAGERSRFRGALQACAIGDLREGGANRAPLRCAELPHAASRLAAEIDDIVAA
jgi:hypothetical protein